jgi:hypothetical protein
MIHKNQSIKELLSWQPIRKGCESDSVSNRRIVNESLQSLIFSKPLVQAILSITMISLFEAKEELALSKNSSKAVKFDKGKQLLVLQCVSRLGVTPRASLFIT